ncbi:MAG: hypothetical protein R3C13_09685 [Hyphomonas sp.]|uniref:hypothetical protein n=1 Tax=Hyphomonas sp. TaxID=87 RepID=UPI0035285533
MILLFKYFWALLIIGQAGNGAIWWDSTAPQRKKNPELVKDHIRIIWIWYVCAGSIPWLLLGLGVLSGELTIVHDVFFLIPITPFKLAFYVSIEALTLAYIYYVFFRSGAEELSRTPGMLRMMPLQGSPAFWKALALLLLPFHVAFYLMLSGFNSR